MNKMTEPLNSFDLELAKKIIETKFVIGLVTDMEQLLERSEFFFQWELCKLLGLKSRCKKNI